MDINPFGILQDFLAHCFYKYGAFVSRHPKPFVFGPIALTLFLSSLIAVALEASDGNKNMLRKEIADTIRDFNRFVNHNMTIEVNGKTLNFGTDICEKLILCPISNTAVEIFFDVYFSEKLKKDPRVKLEWPVMKFFENKLFLPNNFYGVTLDSENANIERIEMIHLIYHVAGYEDIPSETISRAVEKSLREALDERIHHLNSAMFSLSILKDEMQKNTTYTFPFISLTVFLLMSFTIGSCMTGDWITSKPIEALMGVFVSSLAIVSSGGLLFAMGIPYISQVTVMPFLAFTIGVDDTYVMLGAWQDTKRNLPPEKRMALALEEAGSAISVTSLTSVISFGIGTFSTTPAISIFCKFIAVAIAFDWLYQVTFFAAVMALGGKREYSGYHCVFVWRQMPKEQIALSKSTLFTSPTHKLFSDYIAPFLCKPATRISFVGIYAIYIYFAFYGCSLLRPNLTPSRLLVDDSPLIYYLKMAESRIWSEGVVGRVYVNNAPDLSTFPEKMEPMLKLIEDLESTKYSMGPNSTSVWLREFNNYRQYFAEDDENFYQTFKSFLKISFNKQWNSFIKWEDNPNRPGKQFVNKFYFTTAFKIPDWNARTELLLEWRNITSRYPEFQALVFDENNFFSDQMLELKSTTLSSLGTAIIAMIIVCILFIANSQIVFWVVFILVSMDIGVAGYLSLWGADLEPATVMSISLCIDFATHVGYRIYRSPYTDPDKRISDALGAIGWPVVQAGFSTLLGIIVMILVPSNAVRMFARTNVLVVATGLFHGVFLLPIIIRSFASDFIGIPSKPEKGLKTT
uniref:SSD domain-containing protein n=1 Tax=Panagrolaimus sp. PS1159 TaxID=55785 RepID=A0AC35G5Y7_9BILA